jgi:hypothetical protein
MSEPSQAPQLSQDGPDQENIDRVREILFGSQVRNMDKRLDALEDRLLKELASIEEATRRRFDAFEVYVKQEVEALTGRLQQGQEHREQMNKEWFSRLDETSAGLEHKFTQFGDHTAQAHRDLRQQILEQSKNLSDEIRQKYSELAGALAREAQGIRSEKTDRAALSSFFSEIARKLEHEPKP